MLESDEAIVLPALRDPTASSDGEGIPGAEVIEFLGFLSDEMLKAVEILRDETRAELNDEDADASSRLRTLNALNGRRRKLENHLKKELADARSIVKGLKETEDPALIKTLEAEVKGVAQKVGGALQGLMAEFEV